MKKNVSVFIPPLQIYSDAVWHTLQLIGRNKGIEFIKKDNPDSAELTVGKDIEVATSFYENLQKDIFSHSFHFKNDCFIRNMPSNAPNTEGGRIDYLATIFYIVNCLQEYDAPDESFDKYNRFRFAASFQYRFQNVTDNIVQHCIDSFCREHQALKALAEVHQPSKILLTHDIDSLYGAWKIESRWALKKGRIDWMLKMIMEVFTQKHTWFNIDKILKIHSEHDVKSTFFWITQQGRDTEGIKNADYDIRSPKIQTALNSIQKADFEVGLHKSTLDSSFIEEFSRLPKGYISANRFHFLKFNVPQGWVALDEGSVAFDASLGFAEAYGFRNGYGLPFYPFHWKEKRTLKTLITPLNIMDGTLSDYMGIPTSKIQNHIIDFIEKNKTDCLLTLLWHNTEFSEYHFKEFLNVYKNVLCYLNDNSLEVTTVKKVLEQIE